MKIVLFNVSKRTNSTYRAEVSAGDEFEGQLTDGCSITSPVIKMNHVSTNANYMYIERFRRFYYITDITIDTDYQAIYTAEVDVLASFRDSILDKQQYVLRSSSQYNARILDSFYSSSTGKGVKIETAPFITTDVGTYIIGVAGKYTGTNQTMGGAITYYAFSSLDMRRLMDYMFTESNFSAEITDEVVKTFFNPFQYIVSCTWFPWNLGATDGDTVQLGWFNTDINARVQGSGAFRIDEIDIPIPRPVTADLDNYMNFEPYVNYRMYVPYVGMVDIAPSLLLNMTYLRIDGVMDIPTGKMYLRVRASQGTTGSGILVTMLEGTIGCPIALAQTRTQLNEMSGIGAVSSLIGTAMSGVDGAIGQIGDVANSIGNALMASQRQLSVTGSNGAIGQATFERNIVLSCEYISSVQQDNVRFGRPLCETKRLGDLTGFVICKNAKINIPIALKAESDQINQYLNGGMYIE